MLDDPLTKTESRKDSTNSPPLRKRRRLSDAIDLLPEHMHLCAQTVPEQSTESDDFIQSYPATAKWSLMYGINMLEELIAQIQESDIAQTRKKRFSTDCRTYIDIIKSGKDVKPITATEYEQHIQQSAPSWENVLVVCSSREARNLLQRFDFRVPLLIPSELNDSPEPRSLYPKQHYEDILKFRKHAKGESYMDIQDLSTKHTTRRLKTSTAFARMNDPSGLPINFLDIRPVRQNVLPWEIDGLVDYSILHEATEYGGVSNYADAAPTDLSNKDGFALWGKQGVWSFPHIDEHGLYTGVLCESGSKLWFSWFLTASEREEWAVPRQAGVRYEPEKAGFPILLKRRGFAYTTAGDGACAPLAGGGGYAWVSFLVYEDDGGDGGECVDGFEVSFDYE